MSCSSQLEFEEKKKIIKQTKEKKKCLNQSFGFILSKGRLTVVLLAQSGVTGGFFFFFFFVVCETVNNGL